MAAGRSSKNLIGRRRRVGEDEEEDEVASLRDSQSSGSAPSDGEEAASEDAAAGAETQAGSSNGSKKTRKMKSKQDDESKDNAVQKPEFKATADTEAMMQGLKVSGAAQDAVDFEQKPSEPVEPAKPAKDEKRHVADPGYAPNRGNFFMHDNRARNGVQSFGTGRGRGRGGQANGGHHGMNYKPSEQVWKHDLHEAINEETTHDQGGQSSARLFTKATAEPPANTAPVSFSSTTLIGRVQIRVMLQGMPKAITYAEVPLKKYVRLPDHRPPLRRDKPLRIFLPNFGPRYIFPATERSFIFIPRQMRPNHRGFGSNAQRSIAGIGYSSRRTSMYAGSVYSASIAASRRSSIARDREGMFSPGSYASGFQPPNRPVVRLPRNAQFHDSITPPMMPFSGQQTPVYQIHTYSLPQQPAFQGTPTTNVQHPRPQKAISVSGIESPAALAQRQTPAEQPFHSQLPTHMVEQQPYFSPRQQFAYPNGAAPSLPQVLEQGQGYMYNYGQPYYYGAMPMPMYMPQQPYVYPQGDAPAAQGFQEQQSSGMVAHESNGMVFYMPASEVSQAAPAEQYQPADGFVPNYAVPGLPPTPGPDRDSGYYYGGYYQPMQQS